MSEPLRSVRIRWLDASSVKMGWADIEEYRSKIELDEIETVGFVVMEDAALVAVTMSHTPLAANPRRVPDDLVNTMDVLAIPRMAILSMVDL